MDYVSVNRANWDERAPLHAVSELYGVDQLVSDPLGLSVVVEVDRQMLGDIAGQRGVHLQCHIGTDTLSLARLGAVMSGLDFSGVSLQEARRLAERAGADIDYREAEVYEALEVFEPNAFDLVYTGIGSLCWLPDLTRWAEVVAGLLAPGGRLFLREVHPMLAGLSLEEGRLTPTLACFGYAGPVVWDDPSTYVDTSTSLRNSLTYSWNHAIGEVVTGLLTAGLRITTLVEHDSVPWNAIPGHMSPDEQGEWRLSKDPARLAASYTLQAVKEHT